MARTAIDLPRAMERSIREANELMEVSRRQLEVMRRQADQALEQAERMNELLGRVVRLTEPLERAQRGGEYVGEALKRAIFGDERAALEMQGGDDDARARDSATRDRSEAPPAPRSVALDAEEAALDGEEAAIDAEKRKPDR
jgi:hypothetical protein